MNGERVCTWSETFLRSAHRSHFNYSLYSITNLMTAAAFFRERECIHIWFRGSYLRLFPKAINNPLLKKNNKEMLVYYREYASILNKKIQYLNYKHALEKLWYQSLSTHPDVPSDEFNTFWSEYKLLCVLEKKLNRDVEGQQNTKSKKRKLEECLEAEAESLKDQKLGLQEVQMRLDFTHWYFRTRIVPNTCIGSK
jgi:hypothetical protein